MPENISNSTDAYEALPYPDYVHPYTHPDRLYTIAITHGLKPAPVLNCRVLELGCASGSNLIPMAEALPGSTFVGIDLSPRQINAGNAIIAELGLGNIQLLQKSILDITPDFGTFDYIIAHGVYSWVPADVRDKVLDICHHNLAANGVATVSYNTLPGWSHRGVIREILCYHTRHIADPRQRIAQARATLEFVAQSIPPNQKAYAASIKEEIALVRAGSDSYLFHDYLEIVNEPCYFHEFVSHAAGHGLQYLAEAQPHTMYANDLAPQAREGVSRIGDLIDQQQCFDLIRDRAFRQTLVCHKDIAIQRQFDPKFLQGLYATSTMKPAPNLRVDSKSDEDFITDSGNRFTTSSPIVKATILKLIKAHPSRIPIDDLVRSAASPDKPADPLNDPARLIWDLYTHNAAELYPRQIDFSPVATQRPVARPLARARALKANAVANMLHKNIPIDAAAKYFFPLLDGTRDRAALLNEVDALLNTGRLPEANNLRTLPPAQRREALSKVLDSALAKLASACLLIA